MAKAEIKLFHNLAACNSFLNRLVKKKKIYSASLTIADNGHRDYILVVLHA